jgi:Cft2 family RNA processing exonuclease
VFFFLGFFLQILSEPSEIIAQSGQRLPLRMTVEYISFSAHVDFLQNSEFIDLINAPHVVCSPIREASCDARPKKPIPRVYFL